MSDKSNPNNPETLLEISSCEYELENYEQCVVFAEKCIAAGIAAGGTGETLADAYSNIGCVHQFIFRDSIVAIEYFTKAIDIDKHSSFYWNRACSY